MIYKGKVSEKGSRLERNKDELLQLESNFAVILGGGGSSGWRLEPGKDPPETGRLVFYTLSSQITGGCLFKSPEKGQPGALGTNT